MAKRNIINLLDNSNIGKELKRALSFLLGYTVIDEASLSVLRPDRQKRFYYHESDFIVSKDGIRYVVSNQWAIYDTRP